MQLSKSPSHKKNASAFLDIANDDLKSAIQLYKNKKYPQSVFFLQQSIEKGCKSYGLYHEIFDNDFLHRVSHDPIKVYKKILSRYDDIMDDLQPLPGGTTIQEFQFFLDQIENVDNSFINFLKLPIDEINHDFDIQFQRPRKATSVTELMQYLDADGTYLTKYLDILYEWMEEFKNGEIIFNNPVECKKIIEKKMVLIRPIMMDWAEDKLRSQRKEHLIRERLNKEFDRRFPQYEKYLEITIRSYFYQISSMYPLLLLALITRVHENYSRYPEGDFNFHPKKFYRKKLPLMSSFPILCEYTGQCLRRLSKNFHFSDEGIVGLNSASRELLF